MTAEEPKEVPSFEQAIFDQVISPLNRDSFLSEFWGKSFLRLPGPAGRFISLLPWDELSYILEQYRLEPPRLKVVRDGKNIDPTRYLAINLERSALNPAGLITCLSEGATVVIDNVDELAPAVGRLAEAFQEVLRSRTSVNVYAGWGNETGLGLHWDPQDLMILQLSGRKRWKVYQPTRLHPLRKDLERPPKPSGEPVWDGLLEDGDLIYIPRGWWHVAFPLDEPTLHLTVTIVPAAGTELLRWCLEQLKSHPEIRMNVPHLASEADQKRYVARLVQLLTELCEDHVLQRFMTEFEMKIPLRPHIRLPFAPTENKAPLTMETLVRLVRTRRVLFDPPSANGTVCFYVGGIRSECSTDLVPALQLLSGMASRSVRELCAQLPDPSATSKQLLIVLTALTMRGVLQVEYQENHSL